MARIMLLLQSTGGPSARYSFLMSSFERATPKSEGDMFCSWKVCGRSEERSSYSPVCMRVGNVRIIFIDGLLVLMLVPTELNQITGIAAILTFPLDIEVVEAEEREAKEEERKRTEVNDAS